MGKERSELVHISFGLELSRHIHSSAPDASGRGLWDLQLVPQRHSGTSSVMIRANAALASDAGVMSSRAAVLVRVSEQPAGLRCKCLCRAVAETSLSF